MLKKNMIFYVGNKFAFKIYRADCSDNEGTLFVGYEREGKLTDFNIKMRKGDKWRVGRCRELNESTFKRSAYI